MLVALGALLLLPDTASRFQTAPAGDVACSTCRDSGLAVDVPPAGCNGVGDCGCSVAFHLLDARVTIDAAARAPLMMMALMNTMMMLLQLEKILWANRDADAIVRRPWKNAHGDGQKGVPKSFLDCVRFTGALLKTRHVSLGGGFGNVVKAQENS